MTKFQQFLKSRIFKFAVIPILSVIILTPLAIYLTDKIAGGPAGDGSLKYDLFISPGTSTAKVTKELSSNGMIKSPRYFQFLLKVTGNAGKLQQGLYQIDSGMTASKIMQTLVEGKVKMIAFTIPEGYNNRQIGDLLVNKNLMKSREDFLKLASDPEMLKKFNIPAKTSEGYLFPETYNVPYNYPADKIHESMVKRFFSMLGKIEKAKGITPEELHQKVILASIIEREAKKREELPLMAGVFIKRISKKIPLESCATVQYLFDKPKKRLFEKDLLIPSDYNTYLHRGFPPGPISSPGMNALQAAFNPVETDSLFFLLKPDGSHYFSKNHREHTEAKKKYIDVLYQ